MYKFRYSAFDKEGKKVKNFIEEEELDIARDMLMARKLQVINIERVFRVQDLFVTRTFKADQLASFCGEIGVILDSGVTIIRGLEILINQTDSKSYENVLRQIHGGVKRGLNLSTSMEKTEVFPSLLTDMIASGELSSHLTEILFSMEDFYKREAAIKAKISGASVYPLMLLGVAVLMIVFFNFFVFKELKTLFDDVDELPVLTDMLISSIDYLNAHPFIVIGTIMAVIITVYGLLQLEVVKYISDKYSIRVPVIGNVKMQIVTSRTASSMAIFIKSAVPLVKVMGVVELLVNNKFIGERVAIAKEDIKRGRSIADAFEDAEVFEPMMVQMIRVGEETGQLEEMLFRLADIYEKKTEDSIGKLVALIEPVFTLVVGVVIGVIIIAMAMPIFNMSSML